MEAAIALPVAGWFITPIIGKVVERADSLLKERQKLKKDVEEEIRRLRDVLVPLVRGVIVDAEEQQSENEAVKTWLVELKQVLYDAEDVLDLHRVHIALKHQEDDMKPRCTPKCAWIRKKFKEISSSSSSKSGNLSVAKQIKKITERLEEISKLAHTFHLRDIALKVNADFEIRQKRETHSLPTDEAEVVGRDAVKSDILNSLLPKMEESQDGRKDKFMVLPIVGMAGVGKTTLAKLVYNDKKVRDFFKQRAWVCVGASAAFDVRRLVKNILYSINSQRGRNGNYDYSGTLDALLTTLTRELKVPFLLVLDDAWDKDPLMWKQLLEPLKAIGCCGNKMIVTTREQGVADAIRDRFEPVRLECLNDEDMWAIFRSHALFSEDDSNYYPRLEEIGRSIVKRLQGLPLAAEIIGGILRNKKEPKDWTRILEHRLLEINQDQNGIRSFLMLSYNYLPVHLKLWFSYFSLFPKNYQFTDDKGFSVSFVCAHTKYDIIHQCMAQIFSQFEDGTNSEVSGNNCIAELLNKSLLQCTSSSNQHPYITMHDLLHDLVELISKDEFLQVSDDTITKVLPNLRHVSFFEENFNTEKLFKVNECKGLRTLLYNNVDKVVANSGRLLGSWFESLRCLRVLSIHNFSISSLPNSIGNLRLLRLLDLFLPKLERIPETISSLYINLQVLKVRNCGSLDTLPTSVTRLVNLKYLNVDENLLETINGIGKLINLEQLQEFYVKPEEGHRVSELENLDRLHGSLDIINLEHIECKENAEKAGLDRKKDLEELNLVWKSVEHEEMHSAVLEGLRPSKNLKRLSISNYLGTDLPSWLNGNSLPFLEVLELDGCLKLESFPHVPSLRNVQITDCHKLDESSLNAALEKSPSIEFVCIGPTKLDAFSHFKFLSKIDLYNCSNSYILDLTAMVSLRVLSAFQCPKLRTKGHYVHSSHRRCSLLTLEIEKSSMLLQSLRDGEIVLTSLKRLCVRRDNLDDSILSWCLRDLTALQELEMVNCPSITSMTEEVLCKLKALKRLWITHCGGLRKLDFQVLTSLEELEVNLKFKFKSKVKHCSNLRFSQPPDSLCHRLEILSVSGFTTIQLAGLSRVMQIPPKFIRLNSCTISDSTFIGLEKICQANTLKMRKLLSFPPGFPLEFPDLGFIQNLCIQSYSDIIPLPVLRSLKKLEIEECSNLYFMDVSGLPSLEDLSIVNCSNVKYLPDLRSLKKLNIDNCNNLMFTDAFLPLLEDLCVSNFNLRQLTSLILQVTKAPLRHLSIVRCDELIYFEGNLKLAFLSLGSLRELIFTDCCNLLCLPMDIGLRTLCRLQIRRCPKISSIPDEGFLPSLHIDISDCPELEAR